MSRSANAASSASDVPGDGGTGLAERHDERDLALGRGRRARQVVVAAAEPHSLGAGGHLNGAPQTPTTSAAALERRRGRRGAAAAPATE